MFVFLRILSVYFVCFGKKVWQVVDKEYMVGRLLDLSCEQIVCPYQKVDLVKTGVIVMG